MGKIGILGCGAIGTFVAEYIVTHCQDEYVLVGVCDTVNEHAQVLSEKVFTSVLSFDELIQQSDFIIETASMAAAHTLLSAVLSLQKDIIIISTGVFAKYPELIEKINKSNLTVHVPSGAIAGIDGVQAASTGKIHEIILQTRKSPKALEGAPYILENNIDLFSITSETIIFEGSAREACSAFPKNVNVASTLALAGQGIDATKVQVIVDPHIQQNSHTIIVKGESGSIQLQIKNNPFEDNPKTSKITAYSIVALLNKTKSNIKIG